MGAYGLGHPIDLWELTAAGAKQINDEERQALGDAAYALREKEVELLVGPAPAPTDTVTEETLPARTPVEPVPGTPQNATRSS